MEKIQEKIELLEKIAHRLNEAQAVWALGGSMMLYFNGIVSDFHDIDLMVSEHDGETARAILSEMGEMCPPKANPNSIYRTKLFMEFTVEGIDVDVMAGFSIERDGKLFDCSLYPEQIVENMNLGTERIPMQSPQLWCKYYRLMGREEKAAMVDNALRESTASDG